jgi:hypothetical protein
MDAWMDGTIQRSNAMMNQDVKVLSCEEAKMMRRETAADAVRERENRNKNEPVIFGAEAKSTHLVVIF